MQRRRFDHLVVELSVAAGRLVPRYALWLEFQERGEDPVVLSREAVIRFCDRDLADFLAGHGLSVSDRETRRLRRSLERYDPRHPTPYETMERIFSSAG